MITITGKTLYIQMILHARIIALSLSMLNPEAYCINFSSNNDKLFAEIEMTTENTTLDKLLKSEANTRVLEEYIRSISPEEKTQELKNSLIRSEFFHSLWIGPLDRDGTQIIDLYTLANKGYIVVICLNHNDGSFRSDCSYAKPKITRDDYLIKGRNVK